MDFLQKYCTVDSRDADFWPKPTTNFLNDKNPVISQTIFYKNIGPFDL